MVPYRSSIKSYMRSQMKLRTIIQFTYIIHFGISITFNLHLILLANFKWFYLLFSSYLMCVYGINIPKKNTMNENCSTIPKHVRTKYKMQVQKKSMSLNPPFGFRQIQLIIRILMRIFLVVTLFFCSPSRFIHT